MAHALVRDTHGKIKKLMESGFNERQATALVEVVQNLDLDDLATKGDIQALKGNIDAVRSDMKQLKIDLMRWTATMTAIGVAVLALIKFL